MKKTFALLFLLSFSTLSFAQLKKKNVKFGYVPPSDVNMKYYEADSLAEAVILDDIGYLFFLFKSRQTVYVLKKHRRIKILSEAGLERGDVAINYYSEDRTEKVKSLKVKVFNPDGSEYKLSDDHIFREKIDDKYSRLRFSCPNLQVGSVIDYKYEIESERIAFPRDWQFQYDIPVRYSELTFEHPDRLGYIVLLQNGGYVESHKNYYVMKNIPAMKEEPFITTMDNYRGKLKFQLQAYQTEFGYESFLSTWEKIAEELYDMKRFGRIVKKQGKIKDLYKEISPLLSGVSDEKVKAKIIYSYVNQNFKWNEEHRLLASDDVKHIIKDKRGSSADINLVLISLLRKAGIDANPVLTNPRDEGEISALYPFLAQLGHVFACADLKNGERIFMDGTDPLRPMGYIDAEALNKIGLLIKENGEISWLNLEAKLGRDVFLMELTINEDDELEGKITCKYSGYNAMPERRHYTNDISGKHWTNRLSKKYPDVLVDSIQTENLEDLTQDFKDNFHVIIPDAFSEAGDMLYVNTDYYSNFNENPFLLETRNFPVDFPYPFGESSILRFEVPEGYEVESLPKSISYSLEDKSASLKLRVSHTNNTIQIIKNLDIKKAFFLPEEYAGLKRLFDYNAEKSKEMIVLKKI